MIEQTGSPSQQLAELIELQKQQLNETRFMRNDLGTNNKVVANKTDPFSNSGGSTTSSFIPYAAYSVDGTNVAPISSPQTQAMFGYAGQQLNGNTGSSSDGQKNKGLFHTIFSDEFSRTSLMTPEEREYARSNRSDKFANAGMAFAGGVAGIGTDMAVGAVMPGIAGMAVGAGAGLGVSAFIGNSLDQMKQQQEIDKYLFQNSYRFINSKESNSKYGVGFNPEERKEASEFVRTINSEKFLKDSEVMSMMQNFTEYDLLKTVKDVESFKTKMSSLIDATKSAALTLNATYEQVNAAMGDLMKNGVISEQEFGTMAGQAKLTGSSSGKDAYTVLSTATQMGQETVSGTSANVANQTNDIMQMSQYIEQFKGNIKGIDQDMYDTINQYTMNDPNGSLGTADTIDKTLMATFQNNKLVQTMGAYMMKTDTAGNLVIDEDKYKLVELAMGDEDSMNAVREQLQNDGLSEDVVRSMQNGSVVQKASIDMTNSQWGALLGLTTSAYGSQETFDMFGVGSSSDKALQMVMQAMGGNTQGISGFTGNYASAQTSQAQMQAYMSTLSDPSLKEQFTSVVDGFKDSFAYVIDPVSKEKVWVGEDATSSNKEYDYSNLGSGDFNKDYYKETLFSGMGDVALAAESLKNIEVTHNGSSYTTERVSNIESAGLDDIIAAISKDGFSGDKAKDYSLGDINKKVKDLQQQIDVGLKGDFSESKVQNSLVNSGMSKEAAVDIMEQLEEGSIDMEDVRKKIKSAAASSGLTPEESESFSNSAYEKANTYSVLIANKNALAGASDKINASDDASLDIYRNSLQGSYSMVASLAGRLGDTELEEKAMKAGKSAEKMSRTQYLEGTWAEFSSPFKKDADDMTFEERENMMSKIISNYDKDLLDGQDTERLNEIAKGAIPDKDFSSLNEDGGVWTKSEREALAKELIIAANQLQAASDGTTSETAANSADPNKAITDQTEAYKAMLDLVVEETKAAKDAVDKINNYVPTSGYSGFPKYLMK